MTKQTQKTILISARIPRLIPLEYCNLTRAAKMLEIEVDDIRHFNQVGKIALYRRIEEVEMNEGEV